MTLSLYEKGNKIFEYNPDEPQWWITGFNPRYQDRDANDLEVYGSIHFSEEPELWEAFFDKYGKKDGVSMKKIWLRLISGKKRNISRKKILVMIVCMICSIIPGCAPRSRLERMGNYLETNEQKSDETMQSIMEALEEQDAEELKKLFSPYALKHVENVDEKMEELLEFYPGSDGGYEGNCSITGGTNYGDKTVILRGTYNVMNQTETYQVRFIVVPQNDEEPDKEGLYLIQVMTEEVEPEGFKWRNEEDEPGIYVLEP